jgi:hypothetical protein
MRMMAVYNWDCERRLGRILNFGELELNFVRDRMTYLGIIGQIIAMRFASP